MSSFRAGAAVLAFAALVSGCAALGQFPPSNALIGEWVVEDVDNAGVVDRANLTVAFDETSRISGSAGCNRYTGAYSYDQTTGALTVTPLGVTRMMCVPALMNQEQRLITSLQGATSVETTVDGATVLKSATGRVLLRRRTPANTAAATKAKPPVVTTSTTTATLPPPPTTTTPNYPPSNTQYPLSGGPSTTTTYTPPYASAPPIAPTQVTATGEVYFLERIALPPGATVRIQLRDTARADAPALMLAQQEFAAGTGGPYPFSISAPMNVVPANARLSVAAQIRSGNRLLFTTDTNYPVAVDGPTAPLRLRLVNANPTAPTTLPAPAPTPVAPVPSPTITPVAPAPTQPVIVQPPAPTPPATTLPSIITGPTGPAPLSYRCGSETVKVAFDATMAWMTTADGVIAVPRVNPSDDPFAQRMYSNNRVTFIHDQEGAGGGRVQFARGRAALLTCAKVG